MSRVKMFGRPGNGAPTGDVRKKKFTEHQLDLGMRRSQSMFTLDSMDGGLEGGGIAAPRWSDDQEIGVSGSTVTRLATMGEGDGASFPFTPAYCQPRHQHFFHPSITPMHRYPPPTPLHSLEGNHTKPWTASNDAVNILQQEISKREMKT